MKQLESTTVTVGENTFYIRPFPAFKAANISGKLASIVTPLLAGLLPLADKIGEDGKGAFDVSLDEAAPAITGAFSALSGDKLESILKELLITNKNVSFDDQTTGKTVLLTEDAANELFCTDTQDMFLLAFEVIKLNFKGFFEKLGSRFGSAIAALRNKTAAPSGASMAG